jgi:hypothetical protein
MTPETLHDPKTCTECLVYLEMLAGLRRVEDRQRYERPKARIEFNPLAIGKKFTW